MSPVVEAGEPGARYLAAVQPGVVPQFELVATGTGGVARLRELILALAIRGKLVQQETSHDVRSVSTASDDSDAFQLPAGWRWRTLAELEPELQNGTASRGDPGGQPITVIRLADIKNLRVSTAQTRQVLIRQQDIAKYRLRDGDILITRVNGSADIVGQFNLVVGDLQAIYCDHFIRMRVSREVLNPNYLALFGRSEVIRRRVSELFISTAGQKTVNQGHIGSLPIAVPPVAEQARIVARVDELMRLCDALEAKVHLEAEQHARLLSTLLGTLTDSATPLELAANWQRVAEHFDLLLDRPEAVDALERIILLLAVRGLLVAQDFADGSAESLVSGGTKAKSDSVSSDGLPLGWTVVRLSQVAETRLGKMLDKAKNRGRPKPYLRNTNVQWRRFDLDDIKLMNLEESELSEFRLRNGDLLICEGGEPGRCAIWQDEAAEMYFQKALHRVRPRPGVSAEYIALAIEGDALSGTLAGYFTGATIKHFVGQALDRYTFPLPPSSEQLRIVARVTTLRRLCTDLRQRLQAQQTKQSQLADALVESVLV